MGKLGDQAVGSVVKMKEDGVLQNYIVVQQGKPSSIYDESCNGTWLLREDSIEGHIWDEAETNVLEGSDIQEWLNSVILQKFESDIQNAIKQVKIPYRKGGGLGGVDQNGANGLSCKIFMLSGYEVGWTTSDNQYFPVDGAKLSYFEAGNGTSAKNKRIAKLNGINTYWRLRSPSNANTITTFTVDQGGGYYANAVHGAEHPVRYAFILKPTLSVTDDGEVVTNTAPSTPSSIQVPSTIRAGKEITISWGASTDSEGNLKGYELERRLDAGSWTSVYSGSSLSATDTVPVGTNSVTYRVKAYDSLGLESSYNTSASMGVINNKAPVIASETGEDLGEKNEPFSFTYTITDADNDSVTVKEWLNGKEKRSYTATLGQEETFSVAAYYGEIANGKHTLKVTASDGSATAEKVWTFIKRIPGGEIRNLALLEALKSIKTGPEVINNLTSTSTTSALSAYQGKVLKDLINSRSNVVFGRYSGNGESSRTISVGFTPSVVIIASRGDTAGHGFIAVNGYSAEDTSNGNATALYITSNGFNVYYSINGAQTNNSSLRFNYAAWK